MVPTLVENFKFFCVLVHTKEHTKISYLAFLELYTLISYCITLNSNSYRYKYIDIDNRKRVSTSLAKPFTKIIVEFTTQCC